MSHSKRRSAPAARTTSGRLRTELGYSEWELVLGAFGFIGPTKRLDSVLQALADLYRRDPGTRARLLIVGERHAAELVVAPFAIELMRVM